MEWAKSAEVRDLASETWRQLSSKQNTLIMSPAESPKVRKQKNTAIEKTVISRAKNWADHVGLFQQCGQFSGANHGWKHYATKWPTANISAQTVVTMITHVSLLAMN